MRILTLSVLILVSISTFGLELGHSTLLAGYGVAGSDPQVIEG
jgi:hypothetical protein